MPAYTIEKLPDEPIVIFTGSSEFQRDEGPQLMEDMLACLDAQTAPVYFISFMRDIRLSMDDIVEGSSLMSRGPKAVYHHPNIIENIFVTSSNFIRLAAVGLSAPIFGGLQIKVVDTLAEALAYCRSRVAGG